MEALCHALTIQNLPLVGHPEGDCLYLHHYRAAGQLHSAYSIWHKGQLKSYALDSWIWNHLEIGSIVIPHWPAMAYPKVTQFGDFAFEHVLNALKHESLPDLIAGLQTQYSLQLINGAEHLPIFHNTSARVYSLRPYIVLLKS